MPRSKIYFLANEGMTKLKTPRLPVEFKSTTGIKNNKRQRLRAQLMASAFPEVRFTVDRLGYNTAVKIDYIKLERSTEKL